jgi:voltage-gated potassium channel
MVKGSLIIRRIIYALLLLLALITAGTSAYMLLEGFSFWDALYMTVITISTVGFREVRPLSIHGRIITMSLIFFGVGVLFYTLGTAIEYFFGDFFAENISRRRMNNLIKKLRNHFIICGYGRVGKETVRELAKSNRHFVIVEVDEERAREAEEDNHLVIHGSATEEKVLKEAGIDHARGIAACTGSDADNVYITLSARSLNPEILIVARANSPEVVEKLYRAGANRVISPSIIGGKRIATLLVHPKVSEYLDILGFGEDIEFELEQYEIDENSRAADKSIGELMIRDLTGAVIVLVKFPDGSYDFAPRSGTVLKRGSKIIALGTRAQLDKLEKLIERES